MDRFSAVAQNLAGLAEDEELLSVCRSAHLREAALLLCRGATFESAAADIDGFRAEYSLACRALGLENEADRRLLCTHIADLLTEGLDRDLLLNRFFSPEKPSAEPVICYLRNPIADLAYTEFVRRRRAGVLYADSFNAVCENLSGGECDYAILPIVSGSDGRLIRFESMIAAHGFVVCDICSVAPNPDAAPDTLALLSRGIELPRKTAQNERLCYSFSIPADSDISELLSAAKECKLDVISLGTASTPSRKSFSLTLDITTGRLEAFLAYLVLEEPGFVNTGLFRR